MTSQAPNQNKEAVREKEAKTHEEDATTTVWLLQVTLLFLIC